MNAKERYNKIINTIEELAKGENIGGFVVPVSDHDISDRAFEAADCSTISDNSKNVMFLFLNNCTVIDYINERKMVAVYRMLYDCKEWTHMVVSDAIQMVGLSDYPAFCKKFKKYFGVSPKKAFENKETAVVPVIRDWDVISKDGRSVFVKFDEVDMVDEKFGISREKLMIAHAAANLQSFYKLNDYESETAFKLSEDKQLSLNDTFEYIYNYVWSFVDEDSPERDARLEADLLKPEVIYLYFGCGMSFNEIIIVLMAMSKCKLPRDLEDANRLYLLGFWKFSKHIVNIQNNFMANPRLDDVGYEDIYKYYNKNSYEKDTEQVYLNFVDNCEHLPFDDALDQARFEVFELKKLQQNEGISIIGSSYESVEDEFFDMQDDFEYEPDLDDMDVAEDLFMEHDRFEEFNAYENTLEDMEFSFEAVNRFCDELDAENELEDNKPETNRRLIGYNNLDIEAIAKSLTEEKWT